jgi:dTDP-4-amino-4,6-dideoxygalactose transaminase
MWIRKRIDISYSDLLFGIGKCIVPPNSKKTIEAINGQWRGQSTFTCLSVRTGFDLLLKTLNYQEGGEVLISALTIPDMVEIIEGHGLVAVPLAIDERTALPSAESVKALITDNTCAVIVTHLFGTHSPIDDIARVVKSQNILLIEDLAQAYGAASCGANALSDVSMYSFGTIKAATALGGAILQVQDTTLRESMIRSYKAYPVQNVSDYFKKILKYSTLKALTLSFSFGALVKYCKLFNIDYDELLYKWSKGFSGDGFLLNIRKKPCAPLLAVMKRRFEGNHSQRYQAQTERGKMLHGFASKYYSCLGDGASNHIYWVFPIVANKVEEVDGLIALLRKNGFDATNRQSLIAVEEAPQKSAYTASKAAQLIKSMIYLPCYDGMPMKEVKRLGLLLERASVNDF